jgi:hypothetical protein
VSVTEETRQLEPIKSLAGTYDTLADNVYIPINHNLVRDLLGRVLTQLDAMGLPDRAHHAAKSLLTREVWRWWAFACDNSTTSGLGCIAPIVMVVDSVPVDDSAIDPKSLSNRWGWQSEREWLDSLRPASTVNKETAKGTD